jgi:hypothetical protein
MTYLNSTDRSALVSGLRDLADYLESNPSLPANSPIIYAFPPTATWEEMRAEIDAAAAVLGVAAHLEGGGHYVASQSFGPVEYRAVAIPRKTGDESE